MWITVDHGGDLVQLLQAPPYLSVSCYLVRENDGFTLIDTATPGSAPGIVAAARALGGPIRRIILTHGHRNHAGLLDALHTAGTRCRRACVGPRSAHSTWR
jgi:glyoxylase-like metal-dependent hydrolase (beta-lactamase superfamily II)